MNRLAFALFLLVSLPFVGFSQEHAENTPPKKPADPVASKLSSWINYTSPEGRYRVKMPAQPTLSSQDSASAEGTKFLQYIASAQSADAVCMIGYFDLSDSMKFDLDKARDGVLERLKGTLISDNPITLGEYAGKDLKLTAKAADGTEFLIRARIYVVKARVYFVQFIVLGNSDTPALVTAAGEYFDSFTVSP